MKKYCLCTNCDTNFPEEVWKKNRGCLFCKWEKADAKFDGGLGIVKKGDPFPCYIENKGNILLNDKPAKKYIPS